MVGAGGFGVDLFFVLSSYLITELLIREYNHYGKVDVRSFYIRRALRIWPLYFFFLSASVLLIPYIIPGDKLELNYLLLFILFAGNWGCAAYGFPNSVAAPLWSISLEEQFYLTWPVLISLLGVRRIKQMAITMLVIANVTRLILAFSNPSDVSIWCNTFVRLDPIACGALLSWILRGRVPAMKSAGRIFLFSLGLFIWFLVANFTKATGLTILINYPAVTCGSLLMLISVLRMNGQRWLRFPYLIYLGRISYGLYVYHMFSIAFVARFVAGTLARAPISLCLTIIISAISYRWIEQPFLRIKERFTYVKSRPTSARVGSPLSPNSEVA